MSLLNVESYVFINVFYLALFCIHVCIDDVINKKKRYQQIRFLLTPAKNVASKKSCFSSGIGIFQKFIVGTFPILKTKYWTVHIFF